MRERVQAIDYGIDFYAPQTLETPDGRRIMIAWMQNWDTANSRDESLRFMGQMTLPRELRVRDGRLIQNPVRDLEAYRGAEISYQNVMICGETTLHGIIGLIKGTSKNSGLLARRAVFSQIEGKNRRNTSYPSGFLQR